MTKTPEQIVSGIIPPPAGTKVKRPSGRPKGSFGKKKLIQMAEQAAKEGFTDTPLDYLLRIQNSPMPPELLALLRKTFGSVDRAYIISILPTLAHSLNEWHRLRFEAAKAAIGFKHPKLSAQTVTGRDGDPIKVEIIKPA